MRLVLFKKRTGRGPFTLPLVSFALAQRVSNLLHLHRGLSSVAHRPTELTVSHRRNLWRDFVLYIIYPHTDKVNVVFLVPRWEHTCALLIYVLRIWKSFSLFLELEKHVEKNLRIKINKRYMKYNKNKFIGSKYQNFCTSFGRSITDRSRSRK